MYITPNTLYRSLVGYFNLRRVTTSVGTTKKGEDRRSELTLNMTAPTSNRTLAFTNLIEAARLEQAKTDPHAKWMKLIKQPERHALLTKTIYITHCALTYSQTGELFSKQELYDFLKSLGTDKVAVSQEVHKDGKPHHHAYVHFPKRRRVSPMFFQFKGRTADVKTLKTKSDARRWLTYISKSDQPITDFEITDAKPSHKSTGVADTVYATLLARPESLDDLIREYPAFCGNALVKLEAFVIRARHMQQHPKLTWTPLQPLSFPRKDIQTIINWLNSNIKQPREFKQKQLWIYSQYPDFGKTSLIRALDPYLKICRCIIQPNCFFDHYDDGADLIVFDDYNKANGTCDVLNRFLQGDHTTVPIKGSCVSKIKNPPVIFLSNRSLDSMYPNYYKLIEARIQSVQLEDHIFDLVHHLEAESESAESPTIRRQLSQHSAHSNASHALKRDRGPEHASLSPCSKQLKSFGIEQKQITTPSPLEMESDYLTSPIN